MGSGVGGGLTSSISLNELSNYCMNRLQCQREVASVPETRPYDIPYYVTDNSMAEQIWGWTPQMTSRATLDSIVTWAQEHQEIIRAGF